MLAGNFLFIFLIFEGLVYKFFPPKIIKMKKEKEKFKNKNKKIKKFKRETNRNPVANNSMK